MPEDSSLPEILKRDRLKKLDQVDGSIKDAIENWNSILGAYKDAYPTEGRKYHIIGKELKRIRITLRTFRENEKRWINAESTLTTSITSQATIQKLERFMHLTSGEDYFGKPTSEDKTRIRVLARKVRNFKGMDVFSYLRKITPSGTTGFAV
ncbi:unnamed protein product [Pocillopora meandrina]|uniref:Uncharacterized protein n=1 Tax=Pocillopora meandrina TaxID=46732 RepID=A0AAU9XU59_9CNID|nr:unnamed protein product [Pocillopora meandrina]